MFLSLPCFRRGPATLKMSRSVTEAIRDTVGRLPAECGGILGGRPEDGVVSQFHFDHHARRTAAAYSPDHHALNRLLKHEWNPRGLRLFGFVHSHPRGFRQPSVGDLEYARTILEHIPDLEELCLPIVMSAADARRFELLGFAAVRRGKRVVIERRELEVLDDAPAVCPAPTWPAPHAVDAAEAAAAVPPGVHVSFESQGAALGETFLRVADAYDLTRLAVSRVVATGVGGAAAFVEDLARAGIGEFVLIDPDVYRDTNLATQQVYRRDLGRAKVECVAERIREINPLAAVKTCQQRLDDLDDAQLQQLAHTPLREWTVPGQRLWNLGGASVPVRVTLSPQQTLLCGLTDNFAAQARVNRLALQFGLPSLCAQVYHEGRGAEVTFTYPGVTPACHRCVLSSRYKAYLEDGFQNDVTSAGTPIFATTRLNALKGFVALALLHHGSTHPRWGKLLERIGDRNLVQIRMDPDCGLQVFERVLAQADQGRLLFDDVVWLPQRPDCPANGFAACPDCGGTGDLRNALGTFSDTRVLRQ